MKKIALLLLCACLLTLSVFALFSCDNSKIADENSSSGSDTTPGDGNQDAGECAHNSTNWKVIKDLTCTQDGQIQKICLDCGAEIGNPEVIKTSGHTEELISGVDATCIDDGLTDGKKCSKCGEILESQTVISAKGHNEIVFHGKAATCTEPGFTDGKKCSVCGETLLNQEVIGALGHKEIPVPGKDATCKTTGLTEGSKCSECGEILINQVEIPLAPHTYDNDKDSDCNVCGFTRDVSCHHENCEILPKKDATCTEAGITEGKKCLDCGEIIVEQKTIYATGHKDEKLTGYDATCTEDGFTDGKKCSVCGVVTEVQETITSPGHKESEWIVDTEPTCINEGSKRKICSVCEITLKTEAIATVDHNFVNNECTVCGDYDGTKGLEYTLNSDGTAYALSGIGTATDVSEIIVSSSYMGLPVTSISANAFINCTTIRKLTLPNTVKSIGASAFEGCSYLDTILLGNNFGYIAIDDDGFKNCVRLTTLKISSTVVTFDISSFDGCENIRTIIVDEDNAFLTVDENSVLYTKDRSVLLYYPRTLLIPDGVLRLDDANLKEIGAHAFRNNPNLKTVVIGASVEKIADRAFENCINLESVEFIGENEKFTLGSYAFSKCAKLQGITLPAATTEITRYAFDHTGLTNFTIPASTVTIGYNAFSYTDLTAISIPANVTFIGHGAFYNATKLTTINFEARTEEIVIGKINEGDEALVEIANGAFVGTKLTSINIPETATYIGAYAFSGLKTLTTVTIPADAALVTIDTFAFADTSITGITLNEGLTKIESYAFANTKLTSVNIPASVQYIERYAFSIPTLTGVTFTEGSAECIGLHIKNYAFSGANLTSIHLPAQLKAFGEAADKYGYTAISVFYDYIPTQSYQYYKCNLNLTSITVSDANIVFTSIDGVLYKLQGVTNPDTGVTSYYPVRLLFSPTGNLGNSGTVTVPKTVTTVDYAAFIQTQLTRIIFEEYDKEDPNYGVGKLVIGGIDSTSALNDCPPVISNAVTITYDANGNVTRTMSYTNLKLIQFPSHVSAIRNKFIDGLNTLSGYPAELVIEFNPDADVKLVAFAFRNSSAVKTINLPKLNWVGRYAVNGFSNLTELTIAPGSTVTSIGEFAFAGNGSLKSFVLPASVKTIERQAFASCSSLSSFSVEEGSVLEMIGDNAFQQMGSHSANGVYDSEVAYFKIPDTVTAVGLTVFKYARILEIEISNSLTNFGALLEGCSTVSKIHVPETHPTLSSFDGVVYDKNKTAIYLIPSQWDVQTYEIPDTVQYIEAGTFANFKGTYIKLPAALTEIGYGAFQYSNITHIEIPDNVISIGDDAFYYCESLKTITISNNSQLEYVGSRAFYKTAITTINLPDSVETMGRSAFESCYNLASIKIPASLKVLESRVFNNCSSLVSVELNLGLEEIRTSAFAGTTSHQNKLTEIYIPATVKTIEQYVFNNCTSLKSFICDEAAALNFIGTGCFNNCSALETVTFGAAVKNFGYTQLGYNTFEGCNNIKTIALPREMTAIPDGFFKNLPNLQTVILPDVIETIGAEAFLNCPKLTEITIPATIKTIGNAAFAQCTALASVEFEAGSTITSIPKNAFAECTALASINIPDSVITIENTAFAMTAFTEITLPASLETIGDTAFYGCDKLTAINLSASVISIGAKAFANCPELAAVSFNSELNEIGSYAFASCKKLTSVTLPASLKTLTDNPFIGCTNLTLTLDAGNTYFQYNDGVLLDKTGLTIIFYSPALTATEFSLPTNVVYIAGGAFENSQFETIVLNDRITNIPDYAFMDAKSLKNIVIPNSVTTIGDYAFSGCAALETLTIPYSVLSIGNYAFENCVSLANFTLADRKDNITVGSHLFYGCSSITKTYDFPGVTDFTPYMYAGTSVTSVVFADNTNYNVEGVFANSALETVTFGKIVNTTTNILGKAFFSGSKLVSIVIPEEFDQIGESAFANCTNLVSVTMSTPTINDSAFEGCTALTTFTVVKPASASQFQVNVTDRAFANCTSLSNTNIFDYAYYFGTEAFINCSSLTGEVSLYRILSLVDNYAFSGTNFSKITFNGNDFYFYDYSLAGLTEATTVYFASATSLGGLLNTMWSSSYMWVLNTDAQLEFYTLNTSIDEFGVTLNIKEFRWILETVDASQMDISAIVELENALLAYKKSFLTLYPADSLTKDEILLLEEFAANFKIREESIPELKNLWIEYRKTLASELTKHPKYFTEEELLSFNELVGKMDETTKHKIMQAWFEYKIAYNDPTPSKNLTNEEIESLEIFCKTNGIEDAFKEEFMQRWPEYKKQLAEGVMTDYIELTGEELEALEMFCKENNIYNLEAIKKDWMEYKYSLVIEGKEDIRVNEEEEELIWDMIETYGLDDYLFKYLFTSLEYFKSNYAYYILERVPLTKYDYVMIEELNYITDGIAMKYEEEIYNEILKYKKAFYLSGFQPSKELTEKEEEALCDFLERYGILSYYDDVYILFLEYRLDLIYY